MKKVILMMSVLLSCGLFCACSSDDENGITYRKGNIAITRGDMNVLEIREVGGTGTKEECLLDNLICGLDGPVYVTGADNTTYIDYQMKFTATVKNSRYFTGLHLGIENRYHREIADMEVGTSFSTFHFNPHNKLSFSIWGETYSSSHGAWSGQVEVVGKRTDSNGTSFITMKLQDLETCAYDGDWNLHTYLLNGVIEFRICEDGIYPSTPHEPTMEELTTPTDELVFYMLDVVNNELQGRHIFFSDGPEEQECLIINSEGEFRDAYKGDVDLNQQPWTLPTIDFQHCTLVIGRTYGENGGVSLGDYELIDNGDTYQLNMTLNNNVNPNYTYTPDHVNLYFWKIYPKMENKPVVFNRIKQDVNFDPLGEQSAYSKMRHRWLLQSYSDADNVFHQVSRDWGDERYSIEFKENGKVEVRIGGNDYSCYYMLPFTPKVDPNDENNYRDDLTYGVINLWDWNVTEINDDDPLSKQFTRIFNATQFKLWSSDLLVLKISEREFYAFARENLRKDYGL